MADWSLATTVDFFETVLSATFSEPRQEDLMSDETCSGFDPEAIAKAAEPKPSVTWTEEWGAVRPVPRPAVPGRVAALAEELDDLIRWTAELCSPTSPARISLVRQRLQGALAELGAARALLIAAGL